MVLQVPVKTRHAAHDVGVLAQPVVAEPGGGEIVPAHEHGHPLDHGSIPIFFARTDTRPLRRGACRRRP